MPEDYLVEKKIEYLLDMKFKKLQSEFTETKGKMQMLEEEVATLKNKVQRLNSGVSSTQTSLGTWDKEAKVDSKPAKSFERRTDSYDRTGGLTSEDVNIEKMFYFGHK